MFFESGWMPVLEIVRRVYEEYEKRYEPKLGLEQISTHSEAIEYTWKILAAAPEIGVTIADGSTVLASKYLVEFSDPFSSTGRHITLYGGTVGSASWEDEENGWPSRQDKEDQWGPFLFCPVVVTRAFAEQEIGRIAGLGKSTKKRDESPDISDEIVRKFDEGFPVTKKWVRDNLAPEASSDRFKAMWKAAVEKRSDLSKSGPRGPRQPRE